MHSTAWATQQWQSISWRDWKYCGAQSLGLIAPTVLSVLRIPNSHHHQIPTITLEMHFSPQWKDKKMEFDVKSFFSSCFIFWCNISLCSTGLLYTHSNLPASSYCFCFLEIPSQSSLDIHLLVESRFDQVQNQNKPL